MTDIDVTYPPLDTPKPVAEGIWIVDSGPLRAMGMPLPVRMSVIRLSGGGLVLHSPTRFTPALRQALEKIGPIEHLIAPNSVHWTYLTGWTADIPMVRTWGAPGLRDRAQVRKNGVRLDGDLGSAATPPWDGEIEEIVVEGLGGFCEVALFHRASRSLILTDLVQNLETDKLPSWMHLPTRLAGNAAPGGRAPVYLRALVKLKGRQPKEAARRLVALEPERVIFTHGRWFETNGTAHLRQSLDWLLS